MRKAVFNFLQVPLDPRQVKLSNCCIFGKNSFTLRSPPQRPNGRTLILKDNPLHPSSYLNPPYIKKSEMGWIRPTVSRMSKVKSCLRKMKSLIFPHWLKIVWGMILLPVILKFIFLFPTQMQFLIKVSTLLLGGNSSSNFQGASVVSNLSWVLWHAGPIDNSAT